ncbi:MAG: hypothetical protein ACD_41C00310G0001, partial [uncultured bacterium]
GGELFSSFDWQVPLSEVHYMQSCIEWWAKAVSCGNPTNHWFAQWLTTLRRSTLLADSKIILAVSLGYILVAFAKWRQFVRTSWSILWPVYAVCAFGLGFWFYSAPDIRFGLGFISLGFILLLLPVSFTCTKTIGTKPLVGMIVIIGMILLLAGGEYPLTTLSSKNLVTPSDYPPVESETAQLGDYTVYDSESSSYACWDKFPCTSRLNEIELRGPRLQDGFRVNPS